MPRDEPRNPEWDDLSNDERNLGMDRPITRRDFLDGVAIGAGALAGASLLGATFAGCDSGGDSPPPPDTYYPPAETGLRGQFEGSSTVPHAVRDGTFLNSADTVRKTGEHYDLVVVGGGISGLATAVLYRQQFGPDARILILEALDDFGGHAKRNEFTASNGRTIIGYGGSQSIDGPSGFPPEVLRLLSDIGVRLERFYPRSARHPDGRGYMDEDFAERNGFAAKTWTFFDRETFGVDSLVGSSAGESHAAFLEKTPLDPQARRDLLLMSTEDYFPGMSDAAKLDRLASLTYAQFLDEIAGAHPDVKKYMHKDLAGLLALGIDTISALDAAAIGLPVGSGIDAAGDERLCASLSRGGNDPYIFHFPDGNAGVARLLVRDLIPAAFPGVGSPDKSSATMEDATAATVDYLVLDEPDANVRIRLNSPAVRVRHLGADPERSPVEVTYARGQAPESVTADACVMATFNTMVPYLVEGLPGRQEEALRDNVRLALMYSSVQIKSRDAFRKMQTSGVSYPGNAMVFNEIGLDFPVSMGDAYEFPQASSGRDDPCVLHLSSAFYAPDSGDDPRSQARAGRGKLLGLSFRDLELKLRDQMARGFAAGDFDPARDIEGITFNRWAHGYAYEYIRPWDKFWPDGPLPCESARRPFGRIAIAGSDSQGTAYADAAIAQAHRAVGELAGLPGLAA